ncbi:MAG: GNAT family N-acetyltransferase [Desulfobacterales bacterium]|nr:GNAT family N-acetyltransferase [Desulfobacterales bacterium]
MKPLPRNLALRKSEPADHARIIAVMTDWWGGRDLRSSVPRLFLNHFCDTSFVAEKDGELVAFLVGFLSPARPDEGYIHFAGIHPAYRKIGLGRHLFETFFDLCRKNGRRVVRSCTSPVNRGSVSFHQCIGFSIEPGNSIADGIPVTVDYNRPGDPKVRFVKQL